MMLLGVALGVRGVLVPSQPGFEPVASRLPDWRSELRSLATSGFEIAFLDDGEPSALDAALEPMRLHDVGLRVWTPRLGMLARPPRPLAFRWLANRWRLHPKQCVYIAGREPLAVAARRAGWRVVAGAGQDPCDLDSLLGWPGAARTSEF